MGCGWTAVIDLSNSCYFTVMKTALVAMLDFPTSCPPFRKLFPWSDISHHCCSLPGSMFAVLIEPSCAFDLRGVLKMPRPFRRSGISRSK